MDNPLLAPIFDLLGTCPAPEKLENLPFYEAIYPWVTAAARQLRGRLEQEGLMSTLSQNALYALELSLAKRLSDLCTSCMHTKLAIAQVEFSLQGATPRERYLDHISKNYLTPEGLRAFFDEYQELARKIGIALSLWVATTVELLERLKQDLSVLETTFNEGRPLGIVSAVTTNTGDFHNEGRSVSILDFSCGTSIVYKPKNIQISKIFYDFIEKLNTLGVDPPLKGYRVLPRGEYGWEEKVSAEPCENPAEVERYYRRAGMYLCLFYLMNGTDMHYENLIASREHPMLIDLETLFHGVLRFMQKEETTDLMQHSVLATGFLPTFIFNRKNQKNVDISALGSNGESFSVPVWTALHTEGMARIEQPHLQKKSHVVYCQGREIAAKDYLGLILSGFHHIYSLLETNRELIEKEDWWSAPIRIVLRATRFYAYILQRLHSTECVLNKEAHDRELSLLERFTDPSQQFPKAIVEAEKKALLLGDVPFFYSFPNSPHLFFQGKVIEPECLESLRLPLHQMNEEVRKVQEIYIQQAFLVVDAPLHAAEEGVAATQEMESLPSEAEILAQTQKIALSLKQRAFPSSDGSLGWIHLEPHNLGEDRFSLQPLSDTLYSGRLGITLFFAALSRISKNPEWKEVALSTMIPLRRTIHGGKGERLINRVGIGGMTGIGGVIYTLLQTGKLLHLPELFDDARTLIATLDAKHIAEDRQYDLIFGSAGLILSLLTWYEQTQDPKALHLATVAGEHLCKAAVPAEGGALAWPGQDRLLMLGMSHGTAGIGLALLQLARVTGNEQFYNAAKSAVAYERFRFNPQKKNWPRLSLGPDAYMSSWCHGATGIGFARLAGLSCDPDPLARGEVEAAIEATLSHLQNSKMTLCCGDLGRLEFLRAAEQQLGRKDLDGPIARLAASIFHRSKKTDASEDFPAPGFMQGSAGLGFSLLRQIDREGCLPQPLLFR